MRIFCYDTSFHVLFRISVKRISSSTTLYSFYSSVNQTAGSVSFKT
jgi:hypothetical protein